MSKRHISKFSPVKKRIKEQEDAQGDDIRAIVVEELKTQFQLIRELFKEELAPIIDRLGTLEEDVRRIKNKFDNMQTALRHAKKETSEAKMAVGALQEKLARLEDKNRQSNVRLVGLKEGTEGVDPIRFIQNHLPKWIPSLAGKELEIERAHRIYNGKQTTSSHRTIIFKLLRYPDRNAILNGARGAGQILHQGTPLLFFPDYSTHTATKRREMTSARKKLIQKGISSFLLYPALVKVIHRGKSSLFQTPEEIEKFINELDSTESVPLKTTAILFSESEMDEDVPANPLENPGNI